MLPNYYGQEDEMQRVVTKEEKAAFGAGLKNVDAASLLPKGWIAVTDPSSGQVYFANPGTGESSWEMPTA